MTFTLTCRIFLVTFNQYTKTMKIPLHIDCDEITNISTGAIGAIVIETEVHENDIPDIISQIWEYIGTDGLQEYFEREGMHLVHDYELPDG